MNKFLFFTVFLCLCCLVGISIYVIAHQMYQKREKRRYEALYKSLEQYEESLRNGVCTEPILQKQLSDLQTIEMACQYFEERNLIEPFRVFCMESGVIEKHLKLKGNSYLKIASQIYIIGRLQLKEYVDDVLKSFHFPSIYVQVNAFEAISRIGDLEAFVNGFEKVSKNELISEKVILDKLFLFKGNQRELQKALMVKFTIEDTRMNQLIVKYLTMKEGNEELSYMLEIYEEESLDKELKIAILRYFIKKNPKELQEILQQELQNELWEVRAISGRELVRWPSSKNKKLLQKALSDSNWYVRQRSARSLYEATTHINELLPILQGEDVYARDALVSIFSEEGRYDEVEKYIVQANPKKEQGTKVAG